MPGDGYGVDDDDVVDVDDARGDVDRSDGGGHGARRADGGAASSRQQPPPPQQAQQFGGGGGGGGAAPPCGARTGDCVYDSDGEEMMITL